MATANLVFELSANLIADHLKIISIISVIANPYV